MRKFLILLNCLLLMWVYGAMAAPTYSPSQATEVVADCAGHGQHASLSSDLQQTAGVHHCCNSGMAPSPETALTPPRTEGSQHMSWAIPLQLEARIDRLYRPPRFSLAI